jgi:pimeloyl-ACP methyl ester carboxylesterase
MTDTGRPWGSTTPAGPLEPQLHVLPAQGATRGIVLVLHGGKADSHEPARTSHLSARRLRPFARALHRGGAEHGIAVWSLQYRMRGWNGAEMSPVHDARWALAQVRAQHGPVPVVLLGHSMGGRAAVHVLDDPNVVAMVALAPWLPDEPSEGTHGRRMLIAHGRLDRWTSARDSAAWADRARLDARAVTYVRVRRSGHFLFSRTRLWTDLAVGFCLKSLGLEPSVGRVAANVLSEAAAGAPLLTV